MKNWKTTLSGAVGAAVITVVSYVQTGNINLKDLATAAIVAFLGYLAKDAGVSGTQK